MPGAVSRRDGDPAVISRRTLAVAALLSGCLASAPIGASERPVSPSGQISQNGDEFAQLREFWDLLMQRARQAVGDEFSSALLVYEGGRQELPSGTPGDPAMDFQSSGRRGTGVCGAFQPGSRQPYELCPDTPGDLPPDGAAQSCCRHFAFCVPYSRFALAAIDRQSTVVVSPRVARLPPQTWKAILAHEAGHSLDFYVSGSRYGLYDHQDKVAPEVLAALKSGVLKEKDAEIRADDFANIVFADQLGKKICYEAATTLQQLTPPEVPCGAEAGSGAALLAHFPHPPAKS
eukprot:jgi/Tetstr1/448507/TSEL_035773.t1